MFVRIVQVVAGLIAVGGVLWVGFVLSFRTKFGPVQHVIRRVNKRVFNPQQLRTAGKPGAWASVVGHVGRTSGAAYRTPVVAVPTDGGFVIALPYGPVADWVRNVVAAGWARVEHDGEVVRVDRPQLVGTVDADPYFTPKEQRSHRRYGVDDFLLLRRAPELPGSGIRGATMSAHTRDDDPTTTGRQMRAVVQDRYGRPDQVLRVDRIDRPTFGADEVLVRMRATSVNTPDWIAVTGIPGFIRAQAGLRRPRTSVRGTDVAGIVEAVGSDVTDLAPGDEVFGSWWDNSPLAGGAFAELTAGPASQVIAKPAALSFEEAGGAGMVGLTALSAMRDAGRVGPGRRVLINGASGGVGTFAVQVAKALGADVTGVCSTRNVELVRSLGADHVIDYARDDHTRGERRYDVILDNVMNRPPSATIRVLAPGGTFIPNSVGTSGGLLGGAPRMARAALMRLGGTDVRFAGSWVPPNRDDLAQLAQLLESGAVRTVIDEIYPLDRAGDAVAHVLGHHARGKVVLTSDAARR